MSTGHDAKILGVLLSVILLFSVLQLGIYDPFQKLKQDVDNSVPHNNKFQNAFAQAPTPDSDIRRIKNYAIYGLTSVRIGENVTVNSGNIGAHNSVSGLQLSSNSAEVDIEPNAKVIGTNSAVIGDSVRIKMGAVVQNVFFNEILNQG